MMLKASRIFLGFSALSAIAIVSCTSTQPRLPGDEFVQSLLERNAKFEQWMSEREPANCEGITFPSKDKDTLASKRIPPIFPYQADRSGHCQMRFNVNAQGKPVNIKTTSCSEKLFEAESIYAVAQWEFEPKVTDEGPGGYCGVETKMTFILKDSFGQAIPEKGAAFE